MKKHRIGKVIAIVLLTLLFLLLIAVVAGVIYLNSLLDLMDRTEDLGNEHLSESEVYADEPTVDETSSPEEIEDIQQDYQDIQQEEILTEPNIENILLIGSDRRSKGENGRSDAMILLSINRDTEKIHLVSFSRAMYVCIPRTSGDIWGMLNAAYSWGGPKLLIATIENNFRIDIDNYLVVDFESFKDAIDIVGGVSITLTNKEAAHLSAQSFDFPSAGTYTLNGEEALAYSRIRKIDTDFIRTNRQRNVITSLLQKAKTLTIPQMLDLANEILPSVKTDLTNVEVIGYLSQAPTLLNYEISQKMIPIENENGKSFTGKVYIGGMEMYKVDFETNLKALHEFLLS